MSANIGTCDGEEDFFEPMVNHLPKELFVKSTRKALAGLSVALFLLVTGYIILAVIPWIFLPIVWLLLGFSYTAMFSIGHDCQRGSFSRFLIVNSIVGSIVSLPLLIPYESWSILENDPRNSSLAFRNWWYGLWTSINTWIKANIAGLPKIWKPGNRKRIILSALWLYMLAVVIFGSMIKTLGVWGLIKFWLLPWVAYHFWMSTFYSGVFHVPFTKGVSIRVSLSFPVKVPRWLNFLTSDIAYAISVSKPFINSSLEKLRENVPNRNLIKAFDLLFREQNPAYKAESTFVKVNYFDPKTINWLPALWILLSPVFALIGFATVPIRWETAVFFVVCFIGTGLGVTVGYHRLFSHRSYTASTLTKYVLLFCGTSAFQGSCIWWSRDHRAHHRYVDTDKDPYNSKRGFFWAHMGWLLVKQDKKAVGAVDDFDLVNDKALAFQDKYYLPLAVFSAIILPTLIAGYGWGDFLGGLFFASIARSVLVLQCTFCINSLAHYVGSFTFSDVHTPRDCWWVSFLTFGEGYHNFHHEFPYDYRNGVDWYSVDPSKWTIWILSRFGLAYNLKRFPANEIEKGRLQMMAKRIQEKLDALSWGPKPESLPEFTFSELEKRVKEGSSLIAIDGFVIDVSEFIRTHPGGQAIMKAHIGKDATKPFHGSVYDHSNGANNLITQYRIGRIVNEKEKED